MGAKLRTVRRRIRGVQSTMKITRAMELIAASRIRRAQQRVEQARPYASRITEVIQAVTSQTEELEHSLLEDRPDPQAAAVLAVTSDRGLAGAYSSNVLRTTEELSQRLRSEGKEPKYYVTGRKGVSYSRFRQRLVQQRWTGFSEQPGYDQAKEIADTMIQAFLDGEVDEIHVVYTRFISGLTQRPEARRVVPLVVEETEEAPPEPIPLYIFDPGPQEILAALLPRYVETRVFAALVEAAASEHAARRRAMSAATENAEDLIKVLTREANQARQTEITTEIMEIVGATEALQQGAAAS
jgi:F-type H+-transporting ATPase subunit gamma